MARTVAPCRAPRRRVGFLELLGTEIGGGRVDQIARQPDRFHGADHAVGIRAIGHHEPSRCAFFPLRAIARELVGPKAPCDRRQLFLFEPAGEPVGSRGKACRKRTDQQFGRSAGIARAAVADAKQNSRERAVVRRQQHRLACACLETLQLSPGARCRIEAERGQIIAGAHQIDGYAAPALACEHTAGSPCSRLGHQYPSLRYAPGLPPAPSNYVCNRAWQARLIPLSASVASAPALARYLSVY